MIKTPKKSGRYCTYYRLKKGRQFFGPRVWVDIFAVDEADAEAVVEREGKKAAKREAKRARKAQSKAAKLAMMQMKLKHKLEKLDAELSAMPVPVAPKKQDEDQVVQTVVAAAAAAQAEAEAAKAGDKSISVNNGPSGGMFISCMCGAPLIETSPVLVYYQGANVNCDICGKYCPSSGLIYHCPAEKNAQHPTGCGLCAGCVAFQMQRLSQEQKPAAVVEPEPSAPVIPLEEPVAVLPVPSAPPAAAPVVVEEPVDPYEGFAYRAQAQSIAQMGFDDVPKIKALLVQYKGITLNVVQRLINEA